MINVDKLLKIAISIGIEFLATILTIALVKILVMYFPYSIVFIAVAAFAYMIAYKIIKEMF